MINQNLIEELSHSKSNLLAITKYWDLDKTNKIISELKRYKFFIGVGENRIENLKEKKLDREIVHFIGNIQSRKIKDIVKYCSFIHSLDKIEHIEKIEKECEKQGKHISVFIQINVDKNKLGGIKESQINDFLDKLKITQNIKLLGFSMIGKREFTEKEKLDEFKFLKNIKQKYKPDAILSAGTSVDYKIALRENIDIVRIGKALLGK